MQFGRSYEEFEVATYKHWPGKTVTSMTTTCSAC